MTLNAAITQLPAFIFSNGIRYRSDGRRMMKDIGADAYDWSSPKPPAQITLSAGTSGGAMADGVYQVMLVGENLLGKKGGAFSDDPVSVTISGGSGSGKITVTSPVFGDPQVKTLMVYRTRVDEASPFYLANWVNNGTTSISVVGSDDDLDLADFLEPPDCLAGDELALAGPFRYLPPPSKSELETWDGRAWAACERAYTAGKFSATNASTTFDGDTNVILDSSMVGKFFQFDDELVRYRIEEILNPNRFRANVAYAAATRTNGNYSIIGAENSLHYSESGEFEYWPTQNQLTVGDDDGASLQAIASHMDSLLCFTESKIHLVYRSGDPSLPYGRRDSMSTVGTTAPRSVVKTAQGVFFWGGDGFYCYSNQQSQIISLPLGDLVNDIEDARYIKGVYHKRRIYWATHSNETGYLDRIFVFDPMTAVWDVWEGFRLVDLQDVVQEDGEHNLYAEMPCGISYGLFTFREDAYNDGACRKDYSGTATAATGSSLTTTVNFPTAGLGVSGLMVRITGGTGVGQERWILSNTLNTIAVESSWDTIPDATSTFTIGQIKTTAESGDVDFGTPQQLKTVKHLELVFG
jgi:hypothetical protein